MHSTIHTLHHQIFFRIPLNAEREYSYKKLIGHMLITTGYPEAEVGLMPQTEHSCFYASLFARISKMRARLPVGKTTATKVIHYWLVPLR